MVAYSADRSTRAEGRESERPPRTTAGPRRLPGELADALVLALEAGDGYCRYCSSAALLPSSAAA